MDRYGSNFGMIQCYFSFHEVFFLSLFLLQTSGYPKSLFFPFLDLSEGGRGVPKGKTIIFFCDPPLRPQETSFDQSQRILWMTSPSVLSDPMKQSHFVRSVRSVWSAPSCQSGSCPVLSSHSVWVSFNFNFQRL